MNRDNTITVPINGADGISKNIALAETPNFMTEAKQ
jgi:hypothetical protein